MQRYEKISKLSHCALKKKAIWQIISGSNWNRTAYRSYSSIGKPSGSFRNRKRFPEHSSVLICS